MDATGILTTVIANFANLLPFQFTTIECYEQGVRFRAGNPIATCTSDNGWAFWYPCLKSFGRVKVPWIKKSKKTGIHFFWNWFEDIKSHEISELVMETNYQTVTMADEEELTVSLTIAYTIKDVEKLFINVHDFDSSLENLCQGKITNIMVKYTRTEFMDTIEDITTEILDILNEKVYDWGVNIHDVNFVNTPSAISIRHLSSEGAISLGEE